jgi:two-component system NtrC family response regulator
VTAAKTRLAVVEDEAVQRRLMTEALREAGHDVTGFESAEALLAVGESAAFDVVLTDLRLPGMSGVELLRRLREIDPELQALVITAYATIETAVEAIKAGAYGYLRKPIDLEELLVLVRRAGGNRRLLAENRVLKEQLKERYSLKGVIGSSSRMQEVLSLVYRAAPSVATVLITGESGTGKELIARALHLQSPRAPGPFVTVNCAALPETLLEAELFGHEKGAFTGASSARIGRFEAADGGTLFLDEVGEIPVSIQVKLLRFLQERTVERLGSNTLLRLDARLVAATNRDLGLLMRAGLFREDLYWRLNVVTIALPPLRERREDLSPLVAHFLSRHAEANGKSIGGFSREFFTALHQYDFPGNVRELENIVEHAVVMARGGILTVEDLPPYVRPVATPGIESEGRLRDVLESVERGMIERALADTGSVQTKAAQRLGISERMLRYKITKYGLKELRPAAPTGEESSRAPLPS